MRKTFVLMLGIVIGAGSSTMVSGVRANVRSAERSQHNDAAYRDGLYLGQFDARQGREAHTCVGRWSMVSDRNSFAAGYEAGYTKAED
jgi:hypothetical protein